MFTYDYAGESPVWQRSPLWWLRLQRCLASSLRRMKTPFGLNLSRCSNNIPNFLSCSVLSRLRWRRGDRLPCTWYINTYTSAGVTPNSTTILIPYRTAPLLEPLGRGYLLHLGNNYYHHHWSSLMSRVELNIIFTYSPILIANRLANNNKTALENI
jgi:hypothetical protein